MYIVAGSNLFGQWSTKQVVFEDFTNVNILNNLGISGGKLICAAWSYNIIYVDNFYTITGSWKEREHESYLLPLPEDCTENSNLLVAGTDYNVIIVNVNLKTIWVLDLKSDCYKKVSFNEVPCQDFERKNNIIKVTATNNTSIFLTDSGDVYIGLLPSLLDISHIVDRVCDVQCGYEHYMLLTDNGRVYTWGNGRRLQLGHGDINNLESPTEVEALSGITIVKIRAGGWHSMALSEFGDLYIWGWNDTGQLGIKTTCESNKNEEQQTDFGIPTIVNIFDEEENELEVNIKDIACGTRHSVILLEDNSVWTTGNNKYGQLGFPIEKYPKLDFFKKSYVCTADSQILCGPWCSIIES